MTATEHHRRGMFGSLFSGWLEHANYDWGCGPIDLSDIAGLDGHIARRNELRSPLRPGRFRVFGR